jgi:hypothetical protein
MIATLVITAARTSYNTYSAEVMIMLYIIVGELIVSYYLPSLKATRCPVWWDFIVHFRPFLPSSSSPLGSSSKVYCWWVRRLAAHILLCWLREPWLNRVRSQSPKASPYYSSLFSRAWYGYWGHDGYWRSWISVKPLTWLHFWVDKVSKSSQLTLKTWFKVSSDTRDFLHPSMDSNADSGGRLHEEDDSELVKNSF